MESEQDDLYMFISANSLRPEGDHYSIQSELFSLQFNSNYLCTEQT